MNHTLITNNSTDALLLNRFNNRVDVAFSEVYILYRKELNLYASSLFGWTNMLSEDVVEDVFINLWLSKNRFESLGNIKAYLYVSIKNSFIKHYEHAKHVQNHRKYLEKEESFVIDIVESEIYSLVDETFKLVPKLYAEVLRMYLDGWKTEEIATHLGKPDKAVYNIKYEALRILREKISKDKLLIMTLLLHGVDF